jgi:diguanylate cyclase (GGDEF)-like protein
MLMASSRSTDVLGRIGGEEFMIICPKTTSETAKTAAERMRLAVTNHTMVVDGARYQITASFGVADRSPAMDHPPELLRAADEALYAAKQAGRNRTCVRAQSPAGRPAGTGHQP